MAKSRLDYFAQVRDGLQAAGVDLSRLYEHSRHNGHRRIEERVVGLLTTQAFAMPHDLASHGYPAAVVSQAEATAEAMVRVVTSQIVAIWQEFQGGESQDQPKEGLDGKESVA